MFLTDVEIEHLTRRKQGKAQAQMLRKMGIPFHLRDGRPVVTWEAVNGHHINGDKSDNRPENLSLETRATHNREHGTGVMVECSKCGKQKWYSPSVAARLAQPYQCRPCRYGKNW